MPAAGPASGTDLPAGPPGAPALVRVGTAAGRWVLLATVLGSGIAFLDATVVSIALPAIGDDLDAGLADLQWTVNAYGLTLAGLLLLGGALGDRFGRRRIFVAGVVWFAVASLLCAVAPTAEVLIAARALQGVGAALLAPGSLALIEASFHPADRAQAIGAWSGLGGITAAAGPLVGGWLIEAASWRLIFLINLPLAAVVAWVAVRHVPESRDPAAAGHPVDVVGAALVALGLAGVTYALTQGPGDGWGAPGVAVAGLGGVAGLAAFVWAEHRGRHPMVPLELFASRTFTGANIVTFLVYAALSGALFLLPIQLQEVVGYTPLQAGSALIPLTLVMFALSARAGRLAQRIGPRLPMTVGPLVAAVGLALLARAGAGASYPADVLPGVLVLALGLSLTVAPLTAAVLAAGGEDHAGGSSAVNNCVARVAGLVAVAVVPVLAGLDSAGDAAAFSDGFRTAVWITAGLAAAGGVAALATIRPDPVPPDVTSHCAVGAPPLRCLRVDETPAAPAVG